LSDAYCFYDEDEELFVCIDDEDFMAGLVVANIFPNGYILEDASQYYITEDGNSVYVTE
jgi:hypothetical protein